MPRRTIALKLVFLALVISTCAAFSRAVSAEDCESVFERIRGDWARLETGFLYRATSFKRVLASAEGERVRTGPGPRDFKIEMKRLRAIEPRITEFDIDVVLRGRSMWYSRKTPDGKPEFVAADESRYQEQNESGEVYRSFARSRVIEDSAIKQPMFEPEDARTIWAAFPWPDESLLSDATIEVDPGDFTGEKCETTVRIWPKGRSTSQPAALRRVFHFQKLPSIGWLPTRIDIFSDSELPIRQHEMVWQAVQASSGPVVVPVEHIHRTWGKDPESGARLLNTEDGYVIDRDSMVIRTQQSAADPRWAKVKLGSQLVQPSPMAESNEEPWPMSRIYALSFLGCVLAATALLYIRYRQMRAHSP